MKHEKEIRKRFTKPHHFLAKSNGNVLQTLHAVFTNFDLGNFRTELTLWQRLAFANDHSAYDDARTREDLMDFIGALLKLIEAFRIINQRGNELEKSLHP